MNSLFQPFLDQLAQDLQGVLPPEEIQATVADARAHLVDLQSRLLAEGVPPTSPPNKPSSITATPNPSPMNSNQNKTNSRAPSQLSI